MPLPFRRSAIARRLLRHLSAGMWLAAAAACGGADGSTGPQASARIVFSVVADTILAGSTLSLPPMLTDQRGKPLAASPVAWTSSNSAVVTVSATGTATAHDAGVADVTAASGGRSATIRLVVQPVPVASVQMVPQTIALVTGVTSQLSVVVRDAGGQALSGRPVTYVSSEPAIAPVGVNGLVGAVAAGNAVITASVEGRTATAYVTVTAPNAPARGQPSAVASPPITFGPGDGSFNIRVIFTGTVDPRASAVVADAVDRWQRVIVGDIPNVTADMGAGACYSGQPASRETVDDLLIYVRVVAIDGSGGTLARAGPCLVRSGGQPAVGLVEMDEADLGKSAELIQTVLTHEIGHVLGIGTMWELRGLLYGGGGDDPRFLGAAARDAFATLGGGGALLPIENTGGNGTRDGHWREAAFRTELMTGWISFGLNPLSTMTIASLRDLGYLVAPEAADSYTLPLTNVQVNPQIVGVTGERMVDELVRPTFVVDELGVTRRLPDR